MEQSITHNLVLEEHTVPTSSLPPCFRDYHQVSLRRLSWNSLKSGKQVLDAELLSTNGKRQTGHMDLGVIEIPSSPEPGPSRPLQKPANERRPRKRLPPGGSIIVLTDSDDDVPQDLVLNRACVGHATPSRSQPRGVTQSPSKNPRKAQQPLFLPDPYDSEPGPSNRAATPDRDSASPVVAEQTGENNREFMPLSLSQPGSLLEPEPEVEAPPTDRFVAQVLEIVPDVEPAHVLELIERFREQYKDKVIEPVLHSLFEDPSYPKVDKSKAKGKRKRENEDAEDEGRHTKQLAVEPEPDPFLLKDPQRIAGVHYFEIALVRRVLFLF